MVKRKDSSQDEDGKIGGYGAYSSPIRPARGIKSRNQRSTFAKNWWAKRWLSVIESYETGPRLERGRSYARTGQVLNIDLGVGQVNARVQGSRLKPYAVEMQIKVLSDAQWEQVLDAISEQAIFTAQLLDSVMPQEIETVFEAANIPLFPSESDFFTSCSCPDPANPCKHIAAVYYLLGEQFDLDPFLIFTLRGRTRDQVIEALRGRRAAAVGVANTDEALEVVAVMVPPLDADIHTFWGEAHFDWTAPDFTTPKVNAGVLRQLGAPPGDLRKPLEALYRTMTAHVQARLFGAEDESG